MDVHEEHSSGTEDNGFHDKASEFVAFGVDEVVENSFNVKLVFWIVFSLVKIHYIIQLGVFLWWTEDVLEAYWRFDYPNSLS
jgi:hypothetical protein